MKVDLKTTFYGQGTKMCYHTDNQNTQPKSRVRDHGLCLETGDTPKLSDSSRQLELKRSRSNAIRLSSYPSNQISVRYLSEERSSSSSTVIMLTDPLKRPVLLQQIHSTCGYQKASSVECFPVSCFFILLFLLGTLLLPPVSTPPSGLPLSKPFKLFLNSIFSTNYLLLWLYFFIPLKG